MTLAEFVMHNIAPIAGLLYLLIVLGRNTALSAWERKQFYILWVLEALELIAYNAERVTASWDHPTMLRILLSAIGYSLRPAIIYVLIRLVCVKAPGGLEGCHAASSCAPGCHLCLFCLLHGYCVFL